MSLAKIPTTLPARYQTRYSKGKDLKKYVEKHRRRLRELQELLYAERKRGLLVIFQGMDTSGKDGAISHVMSGVNPQGCSVVSFREPTSIELRHDFLWRAQCRLPERGQIGIFNRSYYEDVLVPLVHEKVLDRNNLPKDRVRDKSFWKDRYRDIAAYEAYLRHEGFTVVKFFLHISKKEQKQRLLDRFNTPSKLWKISESDIHERSYWNDYMLAYEKCFLKTTSRHAPWHIIPADDKIMARLMISDVLIDTLEQLNLSYPKLSPSQTRDLRKLKTLLVKD